MSSFNWTCPFCSRDTTINDDSVHESGSNFTISNSGGSKRFSYFFIVCPNKECKKFTLTAILQDLQFNRHSAHYEAKEVEQTWDLIPPSKAKAFPDYVPEPIIDDYNEACLIASLSPKASATLARRCLQGILRDYWKVKPGRLVDEIKQIEDKVDPLTWAAIDAVRKVGNIGAHMEKDINLIVDVEPNEAELLIGLIETLIKDWYVAKEERQRRLFEISSLANSKKPKPKDAEQDAGGNGD